MHLHSDFRALMPSRSKVARLLNNPAHSDGAFARVVVLDPTTVIKATSCPATNLLFEELLSLAKTRGGPPQALPAVFKDLGTCVADHDNIPYRVWEVEHLFIGQDLVEMRHARVLGRHRLAKLKPGYQTRTARSSEPMLARLQDAVRQERSLLPPDLDWQGNAALASAMAVRTEGALREAFLFLESFVRRHEMELDLLTQGNLLLDLFGQPVFSDPVNPVMRMDDDVFVPRPPRCASQECLVVEVPVALSDGLQVVLEHRSTFAMAPDSLSRVEQQCKDMGLSYQRLNWDDPRRLTLEQLKPRLTRIWDVPQAATRLKDGSYERLLHTF